MSFFIKLLSYSALPYILILAGRPVTLHTILVYPYATISGYSYYVNKQIKYRVLQTCIRLHVMLEQLTRYLHEEYRALAKQLTYYQFNEGKYRTRAAHAHRIITLASVFSWYQLQQTALYFF